VRVRSLQNPWLAALVLLPRWRAVQRLLPAILALLLGLATRRWLPHTCSSTSWPSPLRFDRVVDHRQPSQA
jgi:hypothetical protein